MSRPRLLTVIITTPHTITGPDIRSVCALSIQERLRLDAPHQVVTHQAWSFVDLPVPPTTVELRYSTGFADGAADDQGVGEVEGEILKAMKSAFRHSDVHFCHTRVDVKSG